MIFSKPFSVLLNMAIKVDGLVVSNDQFRNFIKEDRQKYSDFIQTRFVVYSHPTIYE